MRRGDFLLTPGWSFHGHHNTRDSPMAWIDGLDIPFVHYTDAGFFEFGPDEITSRETPEISRSERLWGHPGLRPVAAPGPAPKSPLAAYRWEHTDAALADQLALADEGHPGPIEPGHAAVRFSNPATGGDALPTIRAEFHRLRAGAATAERREVGSSVWQVFEGDGRALVDGTEYRLARGDLIAVPSWRSLQLRAGSQLDLFRFSDTPIFERLYQDRVSVADGPAR
jgi:gentisate 1,2-dioxygenase